jgi:hypothetical protein
MARADPLGVPLSWMDSLLLVGRSQSDQNMFSVEARALHNAVMLELVMAVRFELDRFVHSRPALDRDRGSAQCQDDAQSLG